MKLYTRTAACSLSPHIVCRELSLPVELASIDKATNTTPDGLDFLKIHANGYVPVLELDSGVRLTEGPAIVQYLADLKPDAGLAPPAGTIARTRLQAWLNFISTELHVPLKMLLMPTFAMAREPLLNEVAKRLDWLSRQLGANQPYLMGERFSVADPYLFVCLNWSPWNKVDLARWPTLLDFMQRIAARPAVQEALREEGLTPYSTYFHAPRAY